MNLIGTDQIFWDTGFDHVTNQAHILVNFFTCCLFMNTDIYSYTEVWRIRAMLNVPHFNGLTFYRSFSYMNTFLPLIYLHAFALYSSYKIDIYIHVHECIFIFDVEYLRSRKNFKTEYFWIIWFLSVHLWRAVHRHWWLK